LAKFKHSEVILREGEQKGSKSRKSKQLNLPTGSISKASDSMFRAKRNHRFSLSVDCFKPKGDIPRVAGLSPSENFPEKDTKVTSGRFDALT